MSSCGTFEECFYRLVFGVVIVLVPLTSAWHAARKRMDESRALHGVANFYLAAFSAFLHFVLSVLFVAFLYELIGTVAFGNSNVVWQYARDFWLSVAGGA